MKIKTSELTGPALDWAVAKCEGEVTEFGSDGITFGFKLNGELKVFAKGWAASMCWSPSTDWSQGGPIIEREKLCIGARHTNDVIHWDDDVLYWARTTTGGHLKYGPTHLIAAMRCYVASKLGDEVDVPDELTK